MWKIVCLVVCVTFVWGTFADRHEVFVRTHERIPLSYRLEEKASGTEKMFLTIGVRNQNLDWLEKTFNAVSDPKSSRYEIDEMIAPTADDKNVVLQWLESVSIKEVNDVGDALRVVCTVAQAEELFQTTIYRFQNRQYGTSSHPAVLIMKGSIALRQMGSMSIPLALKDIITVVTGISDLPAYERSKNTRKVRLQKDGSIQENVGAAASGYVIPWSLFSLYNIPWDTTATNSANNQSVIEFDNTPAFSPSDYSEFCAAMSVNCPAYLIQGVFNSNDPNGESTLDVEVLFATAPGIASVFWTEKAWIYDFAINFYAEASEGPVPKVVSMSYGWAENDQCTAAPDVCSAFGWNSQQYVSATNTQFMKIGLLGVSLLAATGDSGAPSASNQNCTVNAIYSVFPAASPYVTAVGATMLMEDTPWDSSSTGALYAPAVCSEGICANGTVEYAAMYPDAAITSGGGFSLYSSAPSYQYLAKSSNLPASSWYNSNGRGYPDVAMNGHNYLVYINGNFGAEDGTSASSPAFAAVVSLLNDWRLNNGLPTLGFLNPLLYQMSAAGTGFNDITVGNNWCTETMCCSHAFGFAAAAGWDPVTGLGTPNFAQMLAYIQNLPGHSH